MKEIFQTRLEYFLKCAEEQSFIQAAFKIGVSQPALSSAIKKLEEELEVSLFLRSRTGIKLTEAGQGLFQELMGAHKELHQRIHRAIRRQSSEVLRIGSTGHLASRFFLDVLDKKRKELPLIHLYTSTSLDCYEQVLQGHLEFAFVAWSSKPARLESIRIAEEPVAFVGLRKSFPDLERAKSYKELKRYPWVDLPKPQRDWTKLLESDRPGYLARDVRILRDIILRGLAVGYIQLNFFNAAEKKLLAISEVPGFYTDSGIYAVFKKSLSEESKTYLHLLVQAFKAEEKIKRLEK